MHSSNATNGTPPPLSRRLSRAELSSHSWPTFSRPAPLSGSCLSRREAALPPSPPQTTLLVERVHRVTKLGGDRTHRE